MTTTRGGNALALVALLLAACALAGGVVGYRGGYVAAGVFALVAAALFFGAFERVGDWMARRKP